jgi:hypothetical protein
MEGDIKEVVGVLMRVLGGREVPRDEIKNPEFEATGELPAALNEPCIKLLEFAFDRDPGITNGELDLAMRADLQESLNKAVRASGDQIPVIASAETQSLSGQARRSLRFAHNDSGHARPAFTARHEFSALRCRRRVPLAEEPIPDALLGDNQDRLVRRFLDLLAQIPHVHAQHLDVGLVRPLPAFRHQMPVCQNFSGVNHQLSQQRVFPRRQFRIDTVHPHMALNQIEA